MTNSDDRPVQNRRNFIKQVGLITGCSSILPDLAFNEPKVFVYDKERLVLSTDFVCGGGNVALIAGKPATIRFSPHNEGERGWGQMWWYFLLDGLRPGEKIQLQMELGSPPLPGINKNILFSYDQEVWGRSDSGKLETIEGKEYFVYQHIVRATKVWFAYELPYPADLVEETLLPISKITPGVEAFTLCKTRKGLDVYGFKLNTLAISGKPKYGIWLQARAHAFETGTSWVLHELLLWLCSSDPDAAKLRQQTEITVLPIVDVDAVTEGRTGKNQKPYDHNRGWDKEISHWPEVNRIKSLIKEKSNSNTLDLFIDLHGPGNDTRPYFIVPRDEDLPTDKQRDNRRSFFEILGVRDLSSQTLPSQSMTLFHASKRPLAKIAQDTSSCWVMANTNDAVISLTLEVNMNTPLSTRSGYAEEAKVLGKAISRYFTNNLHRKE